jgi:hydrogenase maturation factor
MMARATGPFDVKMNPQSDDKAAGTALGRLSLDKQFHGDLEAVSKGEMLTAMTEVKGSAAYVAIERVTGRLHRREGSFVLVHRGIMAKGGQEVALMIVPDSGTGDLAGLSGTMAINIVGGKHSYDLDYTLPALS